MLIFSCIPVHQQKDVYVIDGYRSVMSKAISQGTLGVVSHIIRPLKKVITHSFLILL